MFSPGLKLPTDQTIRIDGLRQRPTADVPVKNADQLLSKFSQQNPIFAPVVNSQKFVNEHNQTRYLIQVVIDQASYTLDSDFEFNVNDLLKLQLNPQTQQITLAPPKTTADMLAQLSQAIKNQLVTLPQAPDEKISIDSKRLSDNSQQILKLIQAVLPTKESSSQQLKTQLQELNFIPQLIKASSNNGKLDHNLLRQNFMQALLPQSGKSDFSMTAKPAVTSTTNAQTTFINQPAAISTVRPEQIAKANSPQINTTQSETKLASAITNNATINTQFAKSEVKVVLREQGFAIKHSANQSIAPPTTEINKAAPQQAIQSNTVPAIASISANNKVITPPAIKTNVTKNTETAKLNSNNTDPAIPRATSAVQTPIKHDNSVVIEQRIHAVTQPDTKFIPTKLQVLDVPANTQTVITNKITATLSSPSNTSEIKAQVAPNSTLSSNTNEMTVNNKDQSSKTLIFASNNSQLVEQISRALPEQISLPPSTNIEATLASLSAQLQAIAPKSFNTLQQALQSQAQQLLLQNQLTYSKPQNKAATITAATPMETQANELGSIRQLVSQTLSQMASSQLQTLQPQILSNNEVQIQHLPIMHAFGINWLQIESRTKKHKKKKNEKESSNAIQLRLFLQLPPLDEICAEIESMNNKVQINFWSKSTSTLKTLQGELSTLHQELNKLKQLELNLACKRGMPKRSKPAEHTDQLLSIRT